MSALAMPEAHVPYLVRLSAIGKVRKCVDVKSLSNLFLSFHRKEEMIRILVSARKKRTRIPRFFQTSVCQKL
ncbi:MAG TPA: hypothetical protein DCS30_05560 [Rhizobiales bacterium]|nr:hypothetical protein [Hyphomicrobiales bacterium]